MPLISVIVPVYKVEDYLPNCIESILRQSFTDFELILVDDGSPDRCPALCDTYAEKDNRIRVVHQKNGGIAAARRAGLEIAQGKWILFCDSDDYYLGDELSEFLRTVDFSRTDTLYCFNFRNVWPDHVEQMQPYPPQERCFVSEAEKAEFLSGPEAHKLMGYAVWDKLYARELIERFQIRSLERDRMHHKDDWAEDLDFNLQYCMTVDRIVVSERAAYGLRKHGTPEDQNENGLIGRLDHMMDIFLENLNCQACRQRPQLEAEFWKLVIWHLQRYVYLEVSAKGIESLDGLQQKPYYPQLEAFIRKALQNWKTFGSRWPEQTGSEYRYMLQYVLDHRKLSYKIKNYWLWNIKTRFCNRQETQ